MSLAEVIAGHASLASQISATMFGHRAVADQLWRAMHFQATIEQAKGILIGQRGCSPEDAFDILVRLSQDTNRKLRDVAESLVAQAVSNEH